MPNDEIHPTNRSVRRVVPSGPLGALNASLKSGRDQEIGTDEAGWMTGAPWIVGGRDDRHLRS
jgi:hypothetical protein